MSDGQPLLREINPRGVARVTLNRPTVNDASDEGLLAAFQKKRRPAWASATG
jgi:enoyl-CoA hydratase/carnithine racemase